MDASRFRAQFLYLQCIIGTERTIQAIEDSELFIIDYKDLEQLYDKSPKFERVGRLILEYYLAFLQQRITSYLLDTPEERYMRLIRETPDLLNRVPCSISLLTLVSRRFR